MFQKIRELKPSQITEVEALEANSIVTRSAPKLLAEIEFLDKRELEVKRNFHHMRQSIVEKLPKWAKDFRVKKELWYIWGPPAVTLTKIGSHIPVSFVPTEDDIDKAEQAVRILSPNGNASVPVSSLNHSLMHILSNYALYSLRVYALLPKDQLAKRHKIAAKIQEDLPHLPWTNQRPSVTS